MIQKNCINIRDSLQKKLEGVKTGKSLKYIDKQICLKFNEG